MRVFTATLATETNTFAPMPTGMGTFKEGIWYPAGTHPDRLVLFAGPLWVARQKAREFGWTVIEGLVAMAQPSGITTRETYETLRDQILGELKAALPVQMVLLGLHGAMVADGYDDCEGDLLQRVREIVGPDVVIGANIDPHNHLTRAMVGNADIIVSWKEYPHTDVYERAVELVDLCTAKHEGRINPVPAVVDCGMVVTVRTTLEPGKSIVRRMQELERQNNVLSVSLSHGFPWADVPDMGTRVLVYTDGDADKAKSLARQFADEVIAQREKLSVALPSIDEALDQALAIAGPVVISDGADNPGGGATGDSTFILRRMVERGIKDAAVGPFWDPVALSICFNAGVGARLALRIGGKIGPLSGDPLDLDCTVKALMPDLKMTGMAEGTIVDCGDSVLIDAGGIEIVLTTTRVQAMGTDMFTQLGCDLASRKVIVVKSSQHFYAHYAKVTPNILFANAPGVVTFDLNSLPFKRITHPRWPIKPTA